FVCRYLATGDSFTTIAFSYRLGISTVRRAVLEVCDAVIKNVLRESIPTPGIEQWEKNIEEYWNKWNFPNCVASIDGKHVIILSPPNSGSLYFNYKKTFSIVLMALVDANYNFIAVNVGAFGKDSDGGILSKSKMGRAIFENKFNISSNRLWGCRVGINETPYIRKHLMPIHVITFFSLSFRRLQNHRCLPGTNVSAPCVILGDEAFSLKNNLLRPYPSQQSINDSKKGHFNYRLCRARRVVKNAFGILCQKFRIYNRRMHLKPEYSEKIVLTTCILHNFLRRGDCILDGN
ncbi:uncharacterized protein LOC125058904, partial [Pieris napi]|uniref:uncharacterized protein LOC125058904 n=1 Tax=Pieris napi TaxID=78633 RepID=UPI001FBB7D95